MYFDKIQPRFLSRICYPLYVFLLVLFFDPEDLTTFSSERAISFQRIARHYISEYRTLHNHRCEDLKSYNIFEKCAILLLYSVESEGKQKGRRVCVIYTVVYTPVAGQRPRNRQGVQPLLFNRRMNKHSFLGNGSINTFPR
jgi:hypothetical protein